MWNLSPYLITVYITLHLEIADSGHIPQNIFKYGNINKIRFFRKESYRKNPRKQN